MTAGALLTYSIIAGVSLMILYPVYKLAMASQKQFALNRAALLATYMLALLVIPLAMIYRPETIQSSVAATAPAATYNISLSEANTVEPAYSTLFGTLLWIYLSGFALALIHTVVSQVRLWQLMRDARITRYNGYRIAVTAEACTPFCRWRTIVVGPTESDEIRDMILSHERAHIYLRHRYDLILAQCALALCWYNPAAWLMRRELRGVHEFQADRRVLGEGVDACSYQMLLIKKTVGHEFRSLTNSLNHSKLKIRITMMNKSSKKSRRWLALALVPAAIGATAVLNTSAAESLMEASSAARLSSPESIGKVNETPLEKQEAPGAKSAAPAPTTESEKPTSKTTKGKPITTILLPSATDYTNNESGGAADTESKQAETDVPTLYYVNDKEVSETELKAISPESIESIEIRKDAAANIINLTTKGVQPSEHKTDADAVKDTEVTISDVHIDNVGNTNVRFKVHNLPSISVTGAKFVNGDKSYDAKNMNMNTTDSTSEITVSFKRLTEFKNDCHVTVNINGTTATIYPLRK